MRHAVVGAFLAAPAVAMATDTAAEKAVARCAAACVDVSAKSGALLFLRSESFDACCLQYETRAESFRREGECPDF